MRVAAAGESGAGKLQLCRWFLLEEVAVSNRRSAVLLAALVAVTAVIAGCGSTGAQPRSSLVGSVPSAIVIHEDFKPILACNPNTTVGMEGCAEHKVLAADAQLDADVKAIFDLLSGRALRDFVAGQEAWLTYRSADCRSQSDVYEGGTEQPVVYGYCLASDDSARRQDLRRFFASLVQGLEKQPSFP